MPIRHGQCEADPETKARRACEPLQDYLVLAGRDAGTEIGNRETDAVLSLGCCYNHLAGPVDLAVDQKQQHAEWP